MKTVQILTLMLALSGASNIAFLAGIIARFSGAGLPQSVLTGGGAAASTLVIFFAAIAAYQ